MGGYHTRLSFANVSVSGLTADAALGKFSQGGSLTILKELMTEEQRGWDISEVNVSISGSHFEHYKVSLFQLDESNIGIVNTTFREGNNPTQSLASRAAYGGVLGCRNCPQAVLI